jgi:hypothetical protein
MPRRAPASRPASQNVAEFLASLDHPHKPALLVLREVIRGVDPAIGEEVKWNAPSFRTSEHFATVQLRYRDGVKLVLHLGARPRSDAVARGRVTDPMGLLEWRGLDRALVTFANLADFEAKRDSFTAIVRQWITLVDA